MSKRILAALATALVLGGLLLPGGVARAADAPAGLRVLGRVTSDQGQPLAGAEILVMKREGGLVARAVTDTAGGYHLDLPAAPAYTYWLRAQAQDFAPADSLWLPALNPVVRQDFALTPLYGQVRGTVRDEAGRPLSGARVELLHAGLGVVATVQTDPQGSFAFGKVAAARTASGPYRILARAPEREPLLSAPLGVSPGGVAWTDLTLAPATGRVVGQVLRAADGTALPGARIEAFRPGQGVVAVAAAGAEGRFALDLPPAPDYRLRISSPGLDLAETGVIPVTAGATVDLTGDRLPRLAPATGSVAGVIMDGAGFPVAGRTLALDREGVGTVATTVADAQGFYRFAGLGPEVRYRVRLLATKDHQRQVSSGWFTVEPGQERGLNLRIRAGTLYAYNIAPARIRGQVTSSDGKPLPGVQITLWLDGDADPVAQTETGPNGEYVFDQVNTLPPGEAGYRLTAELEGYWPSDQFSAANPDGLFGIGDREQLRANLVMHRRGGPLSGLVQDSQGRPVAGATVALTALDTGTVHTATTNDRGEYLFSYVEARGWRAYRLLASAPGYLPGDLTPSRPEGLGAIDGAGPRGGVVQDLLLVPAAVTVAGVVEDPHGRPVAGAEVVLESRRSAEPAVRTDTGGAFRFQGLAAGQAYVVRAAAEGYHPAAAVLRTPGPGEMGQQRLALTPATGSVTVILQDAAGLPAIGGRVRLVSHDGQTELGQAIAGATGSAQLDSVPVGPDPRVQLQVWSSGGWVPAQDPVSGYVLPPFLVLAGENRTLEAFVPGAGR